MAGLVFAAKLRVVVPYASPLLRFYIPLASSLLSILRAFASRTPSNCTPFVYHCADSFAAQSLALQVESRHHDWKLP